MRIIILGLAAVASAALLLLISAQPVSAHQPYFEEEDLTAEAPWAIADPTISTALYATLESAGDVDYYAFDGQAGQAILVGLSIPQIDGQAAFNPAIAVLGPGLPAAAEPSQVTVLDAAGAVVLTDERAEAPGSFEPFSRTSYWQRQREYVTLPQDGEYVVAVWHEQGAVGRYTLVVGDREVPGGDRAFARKLGDYWQPVEPAPVVPDQVLPEHRCAG
jgi:hypothetical protein